MPGSDKIKRIVVRTPNWVGDAVMSIPALRELRRLFPAAQITLAAPSGTSDIFLDADFADDILKTERGGLGTFSNAREWRRRHFDLAVLFQNAFAAAATAFFARIPRRVGYESERRSALLTTSISMPVWRDERHESFYYLNIIAELERTLFGTSTVNTAEPRFNLCVSGERKEVARKTLNQAGANPERPTAILCPGSVNSRAKRWPAERYAELADRLIEAGMVVALIGSVGEIDVSSEVMARSKHRPILLTGQTTVAEAVAIISIAHVLITNDTGPAHIGASLKTPTLVIFGPTNPLTTYPYSPAAEMIRRPPDCAPCMLRDCPIDHRCMTAISTEEVFETACQLVAKRTTQVFG